MFFGLKSSFILNPILKVNGKTKDYLFYEDHVLFEKWCEQNEVLDLRNGRLNPTFLRIVRYYMILFFIFFFLFKNLFKFDVMPM